MIERVGEGFVLHYGELSIPFHIQSGARKRLSITVFPEGRLRVLAPQDAATALVLERIERRARWIAKQWRFFRDSPPLTPPRQYLSGETHWYLGRQYRLKVSDTADAQGESVKLKGRFFWIATRDRADVARVQKLLDGWYLAHAQTVFAQRLEKCLLETRRLQLEKPPFEVRRMSKRWGSCTASGKILLNLELIQTPLPCIEYVIIHELCHLKEAHHGKSFYQLLAQCLPEWETRKKRLEEFGI